MHNRWRLDTHHRGGLVGWCAAAIAIAILISLIAAKSAHGAYAPVTQWGNDALQGGEFETPSGVATDSAGNVYVTDEGGTGLVQKFDANGTFLTKWGGQGLTDGKFVAPIGIAVDGAGNVYVADRSGNMNVQKFDSSGNFLTKWGTYGSADGQFSSPTGVAVDASGDVYVMDSGNKRVEKFSSTGTFITKWGSFGSGDGQFRGPYGIATDAAGNVYVTDPDTDASLRSVQKFTSNGTFLAKWNNITARGIAVSGGVMTLANGSFVARYDAATGSFISSFGNFGSGDGEMINAFGIALGSGGAIYVADQGNYRVQKFTSSGTFSAKWGIRYRSRDGQTRLPRDVAVDAAGKVYVADQGNSRVQKFNGDGSFVTKWGTPGTGDGQFRGLTGVAVDGSGNVYTTEVGNLPNDPAQGVQKFDSNGNFIGRWGGFGVGSGQFRSPLGIAVSPANGQVYVVDTGNNRIQRFQPDGTFVSEWGGSGSGDGQFDGLRGIGIDSAGNVYVAEENNARVQKFGPTGTFLAQWPVPLPADVVVDGGRVLVASLESPVYMFTTGGSPLGQFGVRGAGPGEFQQPQGLAVNAESDLYVADVINNRIQMLRDNAAYPRPKAATPLFAPLVPAYAPCGTANRQHAAPLSFASCAPPLQESGFATTGTPDANSAAANMVGSVKLRVLNGNATTPADEADVELTVDVTDVRNPTGLSDYTGELRLSAALRTTDRLNGLAGNGPATGTDTSLTATIGCASTPADASIGSSCSLATTLDSLMPGMVAEGARSIWELGQIQVLDGGPDGDADTPTGNTVFARQGVFVP